MARELRLDLYRIDLSAVVSKYIGETEKNLRRRVRRGGGSGAILLFDEADALFGRRSEVRDSHDRYANIEVSYPAAAHGVVPRPRDPHHEPEDGDRPGVRCVGCGSSVHFPFPDEVQRAAIWRRVFPAETPSRPLDYEKLGRS